MFVDTKLFVAFGDLNRDLSNNLRSLVSNRPLTHTTSWKYPCGRNGHPFGLETRLRICRRLKTCGRDCLMSGGRDDQCGLRMKIRTLGQVVDIFGLDGIDARKTEDV